MLQYLEGCARAAAIDCLRQYHYTRSVPSGKSHYLRFAAGEADYALIVWSIPANKNIAAFVLGAPGCVWELSRLWAPDGHSKNLLSRGISAATKWIARKEAPDALVSYADPNAGHTGGVYRAASWVYHGASEENRVYTHADGRRLARRAFHSGKKAMRKSEIEALGFVESKLPGKERFVKPLSRAAKRVLL